MEIDDQALREFIILWERIYGLPIDEREARLQARHLLDLLEAVYGP